MIRDLFHVGDIYEGFVPAPTVMHGWNDHSIMFRQLLGPDAKLILEVGAWLGNSTLHLCGAAPNAEVVSIDTWLGALEMRGEKRDPYRYMRLNCVHGYPRIYYQFLSNIVNAGKQRQVTPMPFTSRQGLQFLKERNVSPDLVYIDGSHDEADVKDDILGAMALNPRVICGDDFIMGWPGVCRAVNFYFPSAEKNVAGFWWKELR